MLSSIEKAISISDEGRDFGAEGQQARLWCKQFSKGFIQLRYMYSVYKIINYRMYPSHTVTDCKRLPSLLVITFSCISPSANKWLEGNPLCRLPLSSLFLPLQHLVETNLSLIYLLVCKYRKK